jgi:hypothetical protein
MSYSGCDTLYIGGHGAGHAQDSRFVSTLGGIGITAQWMWIRNMAGPRIEGITGISVPSGRRLRT